MVHVITGLVTIKHGIGALLYRVTVPLSFGYYIGVFTY